MIDVSALGKGLVLAGLGLAALGGLLWLAGRFGLPLGRLPGDFHIVRDGFTLDFPLTTMVLVSVGLTVLVNVVLRLWRR